MENKINVAKLLKDCPSGMPLDCAMWDNLYFDRVEDDLIYCYYTLDGYRNITMFVKDGCYTAHKLSKCVIFPTGKTSWEGFVPPKFKDGDIITDGKFIAIFHKLQCEYMYYHCWYRYDNDTSKFEIDFGIGFIDKYRLATEEEKQKLFDVIKTNGYKWNSENRTLEKLSEPRFKDGDILTFTSNYTNTFIYRNKDNEPNLSTSFYVGCNNAPSHNFFIYNKYTLIALNENCDVRLATKEEKQKLFNAIENNGYKWNAENRTLEKLSEPRFKVGNKIKSKTLDIVNPIEIASVTPRIYTFTDGSFQRVEIIDKDYELINEPRFKVGNRVKSKINQYEYTIADIRKDVYIMEHATDKFGYHVPFCNEDNFELIPDKYDINTLKPFDKVLVRDGNDEVWVNAFFGFCDPVTYKKCIFVTGNENWCQCIPYEGNEHLLGTTNDCDEHFKTW